MQMIMVYVLSSLAALFGVAFLIAMLVVLHLRRQPEAKSAEICRLNAELNKVNGVASAKLENLNNRLQDKEESCQQLLLEKDEACKKVLAEKDAALQQKESACQAAIAEKEKSCAAAIAEKDEACKKVLAEKDAALQQKESACQAAIAEKEKSCAAAIAEKDEACKKVLAEKDAALQQKESACQAAIAEKEKSCAAAIAEKDEACKKVLAEKDAALQQKDTACRATISEKEKACSEALDAKQKSCEDILAEKSAALVRKDEDCKRALHEKNVEIERLFAEKEKSFAEAIKGLREQFVNLAAKTLKDQGADLSQLNKTNIDAVLLPLKEQMKRLEDATVKAQTASTNLGESMSKDVSAIGKIAKDLSGVASALSSDTRYQGRKGEEILAEKLRQAGLEENVNFFLQHGIDTDRPDAQVRDTENRWLIIDSKVSLTAYLEYMEAKDDSVRAEKLAAHVASVRGKIDQLAKKKYPNVFTAEHRDRDYLPVTAMFVPYEAPLMEALRVEPSLWQFALENNVILVTPLTLLAYLRLVYLAWQHEKEVKNQQEIVNTARELLSRMNNFLKIFEDVGRSIASLSGVYDKAKSIIVDAPHAHTIANSARKLIDLNVKLESKKGKKVERADCLQEVDELDLAVLPYGTEDVPVENMEGVAG